MRVDRACAGGIEPRESLVRRGPVLLDLVRDPLAHLVLGGRWDAEVREGRTEVEARAAGDDGPAPALDELVDLGVRQRRERAHAHRLFERPEPYEPRGTRRLVRENRQAAVDLHRVRGDDVRPETRCDSLGDGALPGRSRPEDRDHLDTAARRVRVGHRFFRGVGVEQFRSRGVLVSHDSGSPSPVRLGHVPFGRRLGHRPPPHASSLLVKSRQVGHDSAPDPCQSFHDRPARRRCGPFTRGRVSPRGL